MKLTPEQQRLLEEINDDTASSTIFLLERAFLAGLRMGRAEGREQAASIIPNLRGYEFLAAAIRALRDVR